jgi:hypothetical protein
MAARARALLAAILTASVLGACGGGSNGGSDSPPPTPGPGQNPCSTALESDADSGLAAPQQDASRKTTWPDGSPRGRVYDALWLNRQRRLGPAQATASVGPDAADVGEIAVLQDVGDLIAPPNQYDLRGAGLRFTRNGGGGYDVSRIDGTFRSTLGSRVTLSDDDSSAAGVPFAFPFYGGSQQAAFVNSDGNVTFEEEDRASTERNVARLLTGPPRVAVFLADLDPSAGGRVFVQAAADQYTVTWCAVRGFDSPLAITAQLTLLPSGVIEMKFGDGTGLTDAVIGVSPGRTGDFTPVNLSDTGPTGGGDAAVGERFAQQAQLDTVEVARKFYRDHPDNYDQLIIWTDAAVIRDAFAYETTVANEVTGIGIDVFDASRDFGSAGRLRSFAVMDWIGKYPDDPRQQFLGENNTLSVLGQEVGHRWLAFLEFQDHTGRPSDALLGRGQAHWSFFFDSDASVMEGNDIEDLGGGAFRTVASVQRYSRLDQYAMGLIPESEVPTFFYVQNPVNVSPSRDADDAPRVGVTFNGTRRDVLIQDIVAINGPRVPSSAESSRVHRQAFVFVVGAGRSASSADISKIDRIRREWEEFFQQATEGRMRAETRLR